MMIVTDENNELIKSVLLNSGIHFKEIPKEEVIAMCKNYDGGMNYLNLKSIIKAISDIYDGI